MKFRIEDTEDIDKIIIMAAHANPNGIEEMAEMLKKCHKGLSVEIGRYRDSRSRRQEGYYRKWVRSFGEFVGLTEGEMHEEILCQTFGDTVVDTKFGKKRRPKQRSADTNTETYGRLIETLIMVAGGMGFSVPPPTRNLDEAQMREVNEWKLS